MSGIWAGVSERLRAASVDAGVLAYARGLAAAVRLRCGADELAFAVEAGRVSVGAAGPGAITISADEASWREALGARPAPGFQAFTAWQLANPRFTVEGDPLAIAQARAFLEALVEVLRAPQPPAAALARPDLSSVRGGYHAIRDASGRTATVYAESAGEGPPVVCLHTAGADSRQYHGLMAHPALTASWRLVAFDLLAHGRSQPHAGGIYALDEAGYRDWCVAFLEGVVGEPAFVLGCSMGAAMALVLAAERPDLVRGALVLEPPVRARGRRNPYLTHAAVNGGWHTSGYVRGLMSPASPAEGRALAAWIYAQGAPGVYDGDLAFYSDTFDGEAVARRIDGRRTPVHLFAGHYDYSAPPADARFLAGLIEGAALTEMPDLGHFPMVENPDRFCAYLIPALAAMAGRAAPLSGDM